MNTNKFSWPVKTPPSFTERRIVWADDGRSGTAILLVGYCPDTLPYFLGLTEDLIKAFPDVDLNSVIFGKVKESSRVKNFTVLTAVVNGPKRKIKGYTEWESIDFFY